MTLSSSSAASDVYKRQALVKGENEVGHDAVSVAFGVRAVEKVDCFGETVAYYRATERFLAWRGGRTWFVHRAGMRAGLIESSAPNVAPS